MVCGAGGGDTGGAARAGDDGGAGEAAMGTGGNSGADEASVGETIYGAVASGDRVEHEYHLGREPRMNGQEG